ncbi:MAG TPA: TIM barrel protein [Lachnospiraceae bacterium]|nr:TIM barrel protein [Lachnospiraceae bacterium]
MKLGINTVLEHETPEQWAGILKQKGLQAASFPVDFRAPDHVIDAYEKAFHDYGITIAEVGIWNSPFVPDHKLAEKNQETCIHQLELAERVKAKCCVNVSGSAGDCWYGCYPENYSDGLYKRNVEFIQNLIDTVQPQNTYYTLEMMQWMVPDSTDSYLKIMQDVNRSRFAVHFDPVNMVNSAKTAMFYTDYRDEAIHALGPYIKSCHLKDFDIKQELTVQIFETIPGTGRGELKSYIEKINELDPDMPILIEHLNGWKEYDQAIAYVKSFF